MKTKYKVLVSTKPIPEDIKKVDLNNPDNMIYHADSEDNAIGIIKNMKRIGLYAKLMQGAENE